MFWRVLLLFNLAMSVRYLFVFRNGFVHWVALVGGICWTCIFWKDLRER